MDNGERSKIRINSYSKVWNTENKIYSIQNIVLPVPIKPQELLYFLLVAGILLILSYILPFLRFIPVIVRYIIVPYAATQFLLKKKLDGKLPQKYFIGYIRHLFTKHEYYERLTVRTEDKKQKIKISWFCSARNMQRLTI